MTKEQERELKKKLQRVKELGDIIQLSTGRTLTSKQKQEIENIQFKLEFNLDELVYECKIREADLKINSYEQVVNLLNVINKK